MTAVVLNQGDTVGTHQCFHDISIHRGAGVTADKRVGMYCSKLCAKTLEVAMDDKFRSFLPYRE